MTKTVETTIVPAALANGAFGKDSVHCRRSLDIAAGRTKPRAEAKPVPEKPTKAAKPVTAPKASATGIINSAGRIVLKANKEVRMALKAAAKLAGGSRLEPVGFEGFSSFLNGFAAVEGKTTIVTLQVVAKGVELIDRKEVKLVIAKDGSWIVQ